MPNLENDYMEGLRLFYLKRYDEAVALLSRTAEAGEAKSQHFLAMMYENGNGVERDLARAAYWYERTAEQGDREAQLTFSMLCSLGKGVEADIPRGCHWAVRALHQGNAKALQTLDLIRPRAAEAAAAALEASRAAHEAGDDAEAAAQLTRAAECGSADAQYTLARMLYSGMGGVAEDKAEALLWLSDAADSGHKKAAALLAEWKAEQTAPDAGEATVPDEEQAV
ncbi:MAG: sel1 repeat family protein [Ruminococcaceae bacterium]|nr:sel1 repeat family protein [Oscillospiraceae bacterium]